MRVSECMRVLEFVCVYFNLYACISICMRVLEFVYVYLNLYASISICMRVLEFVCVYRNLYACLYLWATVLMPRERFKKFTPPNSTFEYRRPTRKQVSFCGVA